jgi:hypothetical protein
MTAPIDDERSTRLLANALDRAPTACFTVGIATPVAGYLYNLGSFRTTLEPFAFAVGLLSWLASVIVLHLMARRVLRSLRP